MGSADIVEYAVVVGNTILDVAGPSADGGRVRPASAPPPMIFPPATAAAHTALVGAASPSRSKKRRASTRRPRRSWRRLRPCAIPRWG